MTGAQVGGRGPWWRRWLVEPALWIGFMFCSFVVGMLGVKGLLEASASAAWVAGFGYSVLMPVLVFSPGRASRGYSPFGPVVRRVWLRLLGLHLICATAFATLVGLHLSASPLLAPLRVVTSRHPDLADLFLIGGPVAMVIWQGVRSSTMLDETRTAMLAAGVKVGIWADEA